MRSGTWRGVLKWSRHKDRYIGRLYSDIGKVPSGSGIFPENREVTKTPGRSIGPIGPYWRRGERPCESPPCPNRIGLGEGVAPLFPSPSLSLPLFPLRWKEGGGPNPTWTRSPSRTPPMAHPPLGSASSSSPILYILGQGAPQSTIDNLLAMCGAPSTDFHLGHIVVVLRRSPASATSSSPSSRRRAEGTLPRSSTRS